jgi:hypothetical protein
MSRLRLGAAFACSLILGCEPALRVGDLECAPSEEASATGRNAKGVFNEGPMPAPWQTSFDDGFCGYEDQAGFCYSTPNSSFRLVTSPVHTGSLAAAFDIEAGDAIGARHARCVREGALPGEAYYGAWYYVPSALSGAHDWNLFHFQGGEAGQRLDGLWDVSMDDRDGPLTAFVLDMIVPGNERHDPTSPRPIPLDRWFQLEFYIRSAPDATGAVALYQDGEELIRVDGLITNGTPFSQWYVGNFTGSIAPNSPTSSVYVDDVSVRLP